METLHVHALTPPARLHEGDAGYDLQYAGSEPITLQHMQRRLIPTGLRLALPAGYVAFVTPRSGLAARHGITVLNAPGTVDAGYRGEVKVLLINLGGERFVIQPGDRIAQLVLLPIVTPTLRPVALEELDATDRGDGGFGSTGVRG